MRDDLRLMAILAHPDDESLGCGFCLAHYASQGVHVSLVMGTRGERGWGGAPDDFPGLEVLGAIREKELRCAADCLGIEEITFLDYIDGDLDKANPQDAIRKISHAIRRVKPQVVLTFDPAGAYGHPDHIAIAQYAVAAIVAAADVHYADVEGLAPYTVQKTYYMLDTEALVEMVQRVWGGITFEVDGETRLHTPWPNWAATTRVDASASWQKGLDAIACHVSQVEDLMEKLMELPKTNDHLVWTNQTFFRVFSLVNGGREVETDLFAGLR